MEPRKTYWLLVFGSLLLLTNSCVKEVGFVTENFESALVIEAVITNESKKQEIVLSRTYKFEEDGPNPEQNATVRIESSAGVISFNEEEPGRYVSSFPFRAMPNVDYTLKIITNDGNSYSSVPTSLTQETEMDNLYAIRETNDDGINGMSMYVDTYDPTGTSKYYRYEYTEMYKIVAPRWVDQDAIVISYVPPNCEVELIPRAEDKRVCYGQVESNEIIQTTTEGLDEDRLSRFLIRFVDSESYWLTYRYGIVVKQFVQSMEAYRYFETLNNFNASESLFSQSQAGFFEGNIVSETNPEEKVIGFFEVPFVSSKQLFFNYEEFYVDDDPPLFPSACNDLFPELFFKSQDHFITCGDLITGIQSNTIVYAEDNFNLMIPYVMVPRACGDCTALGSNVVPELWVD